MKSSEREEELLCAVRVRRRGEDDIVRLLGDCARLAFTYTAA